MCRGGVGWGIGVDQYDALARRWRERLRWDGEMAICCFSFLFPIFAVVVDFFLAVTVNIFKTCPFFYYSIFIIIDCLFQTANFSWTESRTSKLFRRAELIQTPIIIPVELKSKGENAHFGQTGYKMPCNDLCLWNIIMKCVYMKSLFWEFFGHWRHLVFWKLWPEVQTWK